jgi:hypothetical protein
MIERLCLSVFVITMLSACAASHGASQQQPAPSVAQSEGHHIYVTTRNLDGDCYKDLGPVTFSESFAQSVVAAGDSQAQQLRQLAQEKYASAVDAIINVHQQQNDAGTAVEITGEAVQVENHETVACMARGMPAVADTAAAGAGGGIVGTVIGGLATGGGGSVYGAEAGGAIGATAGAGMELAKQHQQQQANEMFISDRLQQQQTEITQLYQQLTKLVGQQCDAEELSEQDCEQRILAIQQQVRQIAQPAQESKSQGAAVTSASAGTMTEFQVRNRIQEQQEVIDQLQRRITQIKQSTDAQ